MYLLQHSSYEQLLVETFEVGGGSFCIEKK